MLISYHTVVAACGAFNTAPAVLPIELALVIVAGSVTESIIDVCCVAAWGALFVAVTTIELAQFSFAGVVADSVSYPGRGAPFSTIIAVTSVHVAFLDEAVSIANTVPDPFLSAVWGAVVVAVVVIIIARINPALFLADSISLLVPCAAWGAVNMLILEAVVPVIEAARHKTLVVTEAVSYPTPAASWGAGLAVIVVIVARLGEASFLAFPVSHPVEWAPLVALVGQVAVPLVEVAFLIVAFFIADTVSYPFPEALLVAVLGIRDLAVTLVELAVLVEASLVAGAVSEEVRWAAWSTGRIAVFLIVVASLYLASLLAEPVSQHVIPALVGAVVSSGEGAVS